MNPSASTIAARPVLQAWIACTLLLCGALPRAQARGLSRESIVKVYSTIQQYDYQMPWQVGSPGSATGSGFIVRRNRILTNAHVVSNTRFLEVQKAGDAKRYAAQVSFVAHDCDLAVLAVSDPEFFRGTRPLEIGTALPALNDEVSVLGYPMGGTRISITRGVISRIDYSVYSHSGVDSHLVLQVDAAINPGNSGGPVMYQGKVVGVAFQALTQGQNIGYAIPIPVIRHFLADIEDGTYNGYPELGVGYFDLRNPALQQDLHLPPARTGVTLYYIDPFGSAWGHLRPRDVITTIDGYPVANDGTIRLDGNTVEFMELLERKQWGDAIALGVWRDGVATNLAIPLRNRFDPFIYRNSYDKRPRYFIAAGLVFCPLTSEFLRSVAGELAGAGAQHLLYYSQYAKIDGLYTNRDEFVVLADRLAHPINTYSDGFVNAILSEVNGQPIRNLADVKAALSRPSNGYDVIGFEGRHDKLILKADAVGQANDEILQEYGIPSLENLAEDP